MNNKFIFTQKIILYIIPILSLIGIIIPLALDKSNLVLLGSYLAIPFFFAPIIYMIYSKNIKEYFSNYEFIDSNPNKRYYNDHWFVLMLILYFLGFSVSIIILTISEVRPFVYYGIITSIATFILLEILLFNLSNNKRTIILLQIVLVALNIVWGVNLKYYYFIARTDPLVHTWYIYNLIDIGYITNVFSLYQHFPLWHLMVASAYILLNINFPIYKLMYIINGLNFAVMILVIYLICLKLFKDKRIALISALFTSINSDMIVYSMSSLPRSVVSFLEAILLLLLLISSSNIRKRFLVIFLTFIIIIYHTVSMFYIIIIFSILYLLQRLYIGEKDPIKFFDLNYLILVITATLANYIYNANDIFKIINENIVTPEIAGVITKSIIYSPLNELFNYLQYSLLLFFIIIGILGVLESQRFSGFEKIFCIAGFLLVGVSFPGPALLLNKLAANFNLARFGEYSLILISIVGAIGFTGIFYGAGRKLKVIIIVLFIIMTSLSISNDFSASDNPLVKRVFYTFYLEEEEIAGFNQIANTTTGYVMSDYITHRYLQSSPYMNRTNILEIDIDNRILKNSSNDTILIRNEELKKRPVKIFPFTYGYLFSWDEIPGNDSLRLIDILNQKFGIEWVKTAKIEKNNNDKTINVYFERNYILLKLNNEKTKVTLEIDDGRTYELIAKTENDKLKIYMKGKFQLDPNEKSYDYYYGDSLLWNSLEEYNKIYDSGGISGFN